ncbi:DNA polymerase III subunit beta [Desulfobulbus sp. F3]|nr:DNA polymerase III subunit beta [Desulfobulbus sp. F3]
MPFHFNIAKKDLLDAISAQQNITNKKGTLAILSNVLLEVRNNEVVFTGTDLEVSLRQIVPAEVFEGGTLTMPSKKLFELVRESGAETINFKEEEKNWIRISAGSSTYRLAGMLSEEFPQFECYNEQALADIEAEVLCDLIDKTIFSIAADRENMYNLTAALLQKREEDGKIVLRMVTSDGHRLSIMNREAAGMAGLDFGQSILIPRRGVQQLRKFCEELDNCRMGIEQKKLVLESENSVLIIRLMEGDFPDFENILRSLPSDNSMSINKNMFIESLKRINLFTEDVFHAIRFEAQGSRLILTSENADFGSARDEIEITYSGHDLCMGFNCRYFIDALSVLEGDTISAAVNSDESPCLISSAADSGFLGIVMPMKLSSSPSIA